jgi:protein SCO1
MFAIHHRPGALWTLLARGLGSRAVFLSVILPVAVVASALMLTALSGCQRSEAADQSASEALPPLGTVGPFWLTDQDGRTFTEASLDGKVWVAAFLFTRCPTVCPEMVRRMRGLQEQAKARGVPLELVSFSVDPENDTPEVLRAYATAQGLDTRNWRFLTGDSAVIRATAEKGFKIGVEGTPKAGEQHFGITHGTHLVLLDTRRTIRGYYQSSDPVRVHALLEDAARLARE